MAFRPTRLPRPRPVPTVSPTPAPTVAPNNAFTLTTNIETLPAAGVTAAANAVFTAPAGVTPQGVQANTLQSGDVLNGSGQQNVLNATFVTAGVIAPTINNIPTVNVQALAPFSLVDGQSLNLGASTGIATIGDVNSTANVAITGVKSALTTLNKSGGISRNTEVIFQNNVLTGLANAVAINLNGVDGGNIRLEAATPTNTNGYETFNVNAATDSSIGRLISGGSLDNIIVSGGNLSIRGTAGLDALETSLLRFNAAAQTGSITVGRIDNGVGLTQGASVVNAAAEDLNFVGSNNGTTLFVQGTSLGNSDNLAGGTGANDTLVLTGASALPGSVNTVGPNTAPFVASGFETLALTDTDGRGISALSNYDLVNVTGVNTIALGTKSARVTALGNFNYSGPLAINVVGNGTTEAANSFANGIELSTPSGAAGDTTTVNYTLGNRGRTFGNSAINNGGIQLPLVENLSLTYNDFSSSTNLSNAVFQGTLLFPDPNTTSLRNLTITAPTGSSSRGGILLSASADGVGSGAVAGSIRQVTINSAVGVSGLFNQVNGGSVTTAGAGDHTIVARLAGNSININGAAGTGRQILTGNSGADGITGGSGDDTIDGAAGNDALNGSAGDDSIIGGDGTDVINAGDGNDLIEAGNDVDVAFGADGNDTFRIRGAAQQLAADTVEGGAGTNVFNLDADVAGAVTAVFDFDNISNVLTINNTGLVTTPSNRNVTFANIAETAAQTVVLNGANLTTATLNVVNNASSATTTFNLTGGGANDVLAGSLGNDTITGLNGVDQLTGSGGVDTFRYTAAGQTLTTAAATAVNLANADTITDFAPGAGGDLAGFTAAFGVANFAGVSATLLNNYAANSVTLVTLNAGATAGAAAAAGNAAVLVINNTNAAIGAGANDLTAAGLGQNAGLQIVNLGAVAGVNYGNVVAGNFNFAA